MATSSYVYPDNLGNGTYKSYVLFSIFDRHNAAQSTHYANISLYMPESITQPSTISWDSAPLGIVGNTMVSKNVSYDNAKDIVQRMFEGAGYNIMSKGASWFGGNVSSDDLRGAMEGKIVNPYLTILFKGVDFRTFQFSFKFIPHNKKECETIYSIIQEFRKAALPEKLDTGVYLGYPREVDVKYMCYDKENKWLHKFKRCIIKEIDINYTGAGHWTVLRNGFPAETVLNMTLTEREIVVRNDLEEGF